MVIAINLNFKIIIAITVFLGQNKNSGNGLLEYYAPIIRKFGILLQLSLQIILLE